MYEHMYDITEKLYKMSSIEKIDYVLLVVYIYIVSDSLGSNDRTPSSRGRVG